MSSLELRMLISFSLVLGIFFIYYYLKAFFSLAMEERRRTWLYPFYKFRDELVRLRIDGVLDSDDYIFNFYYHATTRMIQIKDDLTISNMVRGLEAIDDPKSMQEQIEMLTSILKGKDKRVKDLVAGFYSDLAMFSLKNSRIVRLATDYKIWGILLKFFAGWVTDIGRRYALLNLNKSFNLAFQSLACI